MKYIRPHLSPELRAQITPVGRRERRFAVAGIVFLTLSLVLALNLIWPKNGSPSNHKAQSNAEQSQLSLRAGSKEILGAATTNPPAFTSYTVKTGDTLFNISQQYNIKWDLIAQVNNLAEPYLLHAGQTLKIPQATTSKIQDKIYTVKTDDTLASIAQKFNITTDDIIAVNPNLQQSDLITPGQIIKLP